MSGKERHNSSKKYLEAKRFVDYCAANNIDLSLEGLESYEKAGLLYPAYRLVVPDEYVREAFQHNLEMERTDFNATFDDGKWDEITQLHNALRGYPFPPSQHFKQALINGHPLDCAYKVGNPLIFKPTEMNFKPWGEYKTYAWMYEGQPMREDTADHYYAPWQIFVLEELNGFHTIEENYAMGWRRGRGVIKKDLRPSRIDGFSEQFQVLYNFRMMEALIRHEFTFDLKATVIEGDLYIKMKSKVDDEARRHYDLLTHYKWLGFMRAMAELYRQYCEREKVKLSAELKRVLSSVINMVMAATQKSFDEIKSDFANGYKGYGAHCLVDGIYFNPRELNAIFPDRRKQMKEATQRTLDSYVKQMNNLLPPECQMPESVGRELVESFSENGQEALLWHMSEIENIWFDRTPPWQNTFWAHLRSLLTSIESIAHDWYGRRYLPQNLNEAFGQELNTLQKSLSADGGITDANTLDDYKNKLDFLLTHSTESFKGICGHHLLITNLTRNYFSHRIKTDPTMLGSQFLDIYKNLIFTLISLYVKRHEQP